MAKGRKVPTSPPESDREREARHMRWAQENTDGLVSGAQAGYQSEGRGAIVITPEGATESKTFGHYISEQKAQETGVGWPDEKTAEMVGTYDPARQFVMVVVDLDGRASAYKIRFVDRLLTPAA